MRMGRVKFLAVSIFILTLVPTGVFISYKTSGLRWEDTLHYIMHEPNVEKAMGWIGLSEETVLKGKKVYWCPMHPQVRRDKPGLCPICNMQLVEMKEGEGEQRVEDAILLTSRQIQQSGIRTATVKRIGLTYQIDTTGRVDVDERLLKTISNWVQGRSRIESLHVNFTGESVRKGDVLLHLYSPELVTTQTEYLMLLREDTSRVAPLLEAAKMRLRRWGITKEQIREIGEKGRPIESIPIYSPMSGTVIERLVSEGGYVAEGEPLLKIADLSRLWVYGDIYESELPYVSTGMPAEVSPRAIPGKVITGKIDFIDPVIQTASRTVRVRFEVENREGILKPGMYARIRIKVPQQEALAVPESAVLFSGRRVIAILSEGNGLMQPVEIRLGRKWFYPEEGVKEKGVFSLDNEERYHEVLSGLKEGQEIVVGGNFLIAAEAQFQGILKKMLPSEGSR